MQHLKLRRRLIKTACSLQQNDLGVGTAGNFSVRVKEGYLITPTGVDYDELIPESIVTMGLQGEVVSGDLKPSSEWRFHQDIYTNRQKVNAIVHTHSPFATGLSCTRQGIPSFHYMVAIAGGDNIRCAEYATFGTRELSENALVALQDRCACLLANHGVIATGEDIAAAFKLAQYVEELARQFVIPGKI